MEPDVTKMLHALTIRGAQAGADLTAMADRNLTQGLGVIQNNLIQQHGGVGDDPGLLMALQAASGVPRQGALVSPAPANVAA